MTFSLRENLLAKLRRKTLYTLCAYQKNPSSSYNLRYYVAHLSIADFSSYQHQPRHKHGSTRSDSVRMQHTFTPVCIVKPVFSLVTDHASLLYQRIHTVPLLASSAVVTVLLGEPVFQPSRSSFNGFPLSVAVSPIFLRVPWPPAGYENNAPTGFLGSNHRQPHFFETRHTYVYSPRQGFPSFSVLARYSWSQTANVYAISYNMTRGNCSLTVIES